MYLYTTESKQHWDNIDQNASSGAHWAKVVTYYSGFEKSKNR